jgi:hypothetical protein
MSGSPKETVDLLSMAKALLDSDPSKGSPLDIRIAVYKVAMAALDAEQGRQVQLAMLSNMFSKR